MVCENKQAEELCPLCGQPNGCEVQKCGTSEGCWCESITISAEILERIPDAQRGKSCVCRICLGKTERTNDEQT
ncbi:MAG: hypothetical protein RIR18_1639 [Pseudomonadota bacterium]|jgi:hypothetical protein